MWRRRIAVVTAFLSIGLLVGAVPAAAAPRGAAGALTAEDGQRFHSRSELPGRHAIGRARTSRYQEASSEGCYLDSLGDVYDVLADAPGTQPSADIVDTCAEYRRALTLTLSVEEPTDPLTDRSWTRESFVAWFIDVDLDSVEDYFVIYQLLDGELAAGVFDTATEEVVCAGLPGFDGVNYMVEIEAACIGDAPSIGSAATMFYEFGTRQYSDNVPDEFAFVGPFTRAAPAPLQCPEPELADQGERVATFRISCGGATTEAVSQAIAVSEALSVFTGSSFEDGAARHAIIARNDDYPDALAGSALGFGLAPLLFTWSPASAAAQGADPNRLADPTRLELQRVLAPGGDVYVLGGTAAVAAGVDDDIRALGYNPIRLAGPSRFDTAGLIAREVRVLVTQLNQANGFPDLKSVMVATGENWVDAVSAGQVAAYWGFPVLLATRDSLPEPTARVLAELQPEFIYIVGGQGVISKATRDLIAPYAVGADRESHCQTSEGVDSPVCRVFGSDRVATAVAVGRLQRDLLDKNRDNGLTPPDAVWAIAVNVRRADGWAHVLTASAATGYLAGVFLPLEGEDGSVITPIASQFACDKLRNLDVLALAGAPDLISPNVAPDLRALLENGCPA